MCVAKFSSQMSTQPCMAICALLPAQGSLSHARPGFNLCTGKHAPRPSSQQLSHLMPVWPGGEEGRPEASRPRGTTACRSCCYAATAPGRSARSAGEQCSDSLLLHVCLSCNDCSALASQQAERLGSTAYPVSLSSNMTKQLCERLELQVLLRYILVRLFQLQMDA